MGSQFLKLFLSYSFFKIVTRFSQLCLIPTALTFKNQPRTDFLVDENGLTLTHSHNHIMNFDTIKLKIPFIADALIFYTWIGQKLCVMKKLSQIKPIPLLILDMKQKWAFRLLGGWGHTTGPQSIIEGWWHVPIFWCVSGRSPTSNINTSFFLNHPLLEHL